MPAWVNLASADLHKGYMGQAYGAWLTPGAEVILKQHKTLNDNTRDFKTFTRIWKKMHRICFQNKRPAHCVVALLYKKGTLQQRQCEILHTILHHIEAINPCFGQFKFNCSFLLHHTQHLSGFFPFIAGLSLKLQPYDFVKGFEKSLHTHPMILQVRNFTSQRSQASLRVYVWMKLTDFCCQHKHSNGESKRQ